MLSSNFCHRCHKNERKTLKVGKTSYTPILCDECALILFGDIEPDNFNEDELEQLERLCK